MNMIFLMKKGYILNLSNITELNQAWHDDTHPYPSILNGILSISPICFQLFVRRSSFTGL